jgi:glycosyltransferase involved in cell wall biosynthesis
LVILGLATESDEIGCSLIDKGRRILFIAPSAYPLGGVATWLDYVVPGLRERGWHVTLGLAEGKFHKVDAYLRVHPDDEVLRIPCGTGTPEGRVRRVSRAIYGARPDIVVAVNIADTTRAVDRIRGMSGWSPRVATTLHGIQADLISSIGTSAGVLDAVVCTNRLACEIVARGTSVEPDRVFYAPYGVDLNYKAQRAQKNSDHVLRLAYVGRLEQAQKRVRDIVGVVAELNWRKFDYELAIVGDGPEEEWLRGQLLNKGGSGRVRFLGVLASSDLPEKVYSRADALLITSLWETGPIVAWEAMKHGTIVVTSAYIGSGLEGSLKPGENCLMFPIGDALAAVDCLERLQDLELRSRLLRDSLTLVTSRYSTTASIEQWDSCFRQIAARPPLPFADRPEKRTRTPPAGRLDRLLGMQLGETVRELLSLRYDHSEPGGEWPHANTYSEVDEEAFWELAMSLERSPSNRVSRSKLPSFAK